MSFNLSAVETRDLEETRLACAWLHGIAQHAEKAGNAPSGAAEWLQSLGMACAGQLERLGEYSTAPLQ